MPQCLELGGVTTEMAIEDLNDNLSGLIVSLTATGVETNTILSGIEGDVYKSLRVQKATLLGIEIISDQDNLIDNIDEE